MNKALIFDIRRFTVHDGPGIRTTVFFKGCPLSCWWCHNPESRDLQPEKSTKHIFLGGRRFEREETTGKWMSAEEVMHEIMQDRIFYDESGGGVTFSGGEPLMQESFLYDLLRDCREQGIHTTLDTSGYATGSSMANISPWVDLFLYDLKIINNELHLKYTGVSNGSILKNLEFLVSSGKNVILRFPVIPGITDTPENIGDMRALLSDLRFTCSAAPQISLLPFHSMAREKYHRFCKTNPMMGVPDLEQKDLFTLKTEFESIGLKVTIGA